MRPLVLVLAIVGSLGCGRAPMSSDSSTSEGGSGDEDADSSGESDDGDAGFDPLVCGSWDPPAATPAATPPNEAECGDACPVFTDVTLAAGLDTLQYIETHPSTFTCIFPKYTPDGPSPRLDCEPQWFTGGVTIGDADGDGWADVYMTRLAAPDHLFLNRGDGTFVDVATGVGLGECSYTNGAQFGDIDDDGDRDLFVTAMGSARHFLFINQLAETGELMFTDEATARGFALASNVPHSGESIGLGDYDRDGWLDVHVTEWLRTPHLPANPELQPLHAGVLLHNRGVAGAGVFDDVTDSLGVSLLGNDEDGVFGFSTSFVDLDADGWPDLAVAVDYHESRLFWNVGGAGFTDGTVTAGVNKEANAMGSTIADVDLDGDFDWYVTSIAQADECEEGQTPPCWLGSGNRMYAYLGEREFVRIEDQLDVRDGAWAWGTGFLDLDNDGDQDLALANGWPGRDLAGGFLHQDTPMRLWINHGPDAAMTEEGEARGVDDRQQGRGLVTFDYDQDGDLDILVANHAGRPVLLRNDGGGANGNGWLRVSVEGTISNTDGRGAKVRVQVEDGGAWQIREVGVGSHFLGSGELTQHFGLGTGVESIHRVEIEWPASGIIQTLDGLGPNQTVHVVEGEP